MAEHCPHYVKGSQFRVGAQYQCCHCGAVATEEQNVGQDPDHGPFAPQVILEAKYDWGDNGDECPGHPTPENLRRHLGKTT